MRKWTLGCCCPVEQMGEARAAGFQYCEPALAPLVKLDDAEFAAVKMRALAAGLPVYAMNVLMPGGELPIVGPNADLALLDAYLEKALGRAAVLGAEIVVFGSGGARKCPGGFPQAQTMAQIDDFLRLCEKHAAPNGITIVIEPLNKGETNTIPFVADGAAIARKLNLPHVKALGDTYHMALEGEPLSALVDAKDVLRHVHIANPVGRVYPAPGDGYDYQALMNALDAAGYAGGVSVEAGTKDFAGDSEQVMKIFG